MVQKQKCAEVNNLKCSITLFMRLNQIGPCLGIQNEIIFVAQKAAKQLELRFKCQEK